VEHWAEIRRLHLSEQLGVKTIARRLGLARNTVRSALASDVAPKYERDRAGSRVDEFEPAIRRLLTEFPDMAATMIDRNSPFLGIYRTEYVLQTGTGATYGCGVIHD